MLNRKDFAKNLAESILNFDSKENFVIGLYGKWGSGKTSIINMMVEEILKGGERPVIIKFEPWNFTNKDSLITQFFKYLKSELMMSDKKKIFNNIGDVLDNYSDALDYAESIPFVNKYSKLIKMTINFGSGRLKKYKGSDVLTAKHKLSEKLQDQNEKILVIIDDIDRLTNEEIRLVFQLVKSIADLPNIIYLLAMDKDIVARALKDVQNCDGEEYLEKIIQVPFHIPETNGLEVEDVFFQEVDKLFGEKEEENFDREHWHNVFRSCIRPFLKNIRDVKRLINTFKFRYNSVSDRVDFIDMLGITAVQLFVPELFKWIKENEMLLCGENYKYSNRVNYQGDDVRNIYVEKLGNIEKNISSDIKISILRCLFPKTDSDLSWNSRNNTDIENYDTRICSHSAFELYFSLDLSKLKVSRNRLQDSINKMKEEELEKFIDNLNESNEIVTYFKFLEESIETIGDSKLALFVKVLSSKMDSMKAIDSKSSLRISTRSECISCIENIFRAIDDKDIIYDTCEFLLTSRGVDGLDKFSKYINRIELAYGRLAGDERSIYEEKQKVSIEHLENLEKLFVSRCKDLKEKLLSETNDFYMIAYLWRSLDFDSFKEYVEELKKDKIKILSFISGMAMSCSSSDEGQGWYYREENYNEFISKEEVLKIIDEMKYNSRFEELKKIEQVKIAIFVLSKDKGIQEYTSENSAYELLEKWKSNRI